MRKKEKRGIEKRDRKSAKAREVRRIERDRGIRINKRMYEV